jgi:hypothetical protein
MVNLDKISFDLNLSTIMYFEYQSEGFGVALHK